MTPGHRDPVSPARFTAWLMLCILAILAGIGLFDWTVLSSVR